MRGSTLNLFLWHFLPYWLASMATFWFIGRGITSLRGVVIGFGSFPALLESLVSVILKRDVAFNVTAKQRTAARNWRHLTFHGVAAVACLFGLVLAFAIHGRQPTSVGISVMWILYTLSMLGGVFWLALRDFGFLGAMRRARQPRQRLVAAQPRPAIGWQAVVATALLVATVGSALVVKSAQAAVRPDTFVVTMKSAPIFGLSLPAGQLRTQPAVIARDLHAAPGIIGRTQTIQDQFDAAWAEQLAAQHAIPWITLQFGQFGPDGKPPLDASLTAIANGTHDDDLRRWATEIRDYGHPVLLTILLHVDRNWALSSAVANGGIPSDAPRAWLHVQAIFHSVGATNVAWVWSPADPAHDQPMRRQPTASTWCC